MALYQHIIKTLSDRFGTFKGEADPTEFANYMIVCLDNDGDFWKKISDCRKTSIKGYVFNSSSVLVADLIRWYEYTPDLPTINPQQYKKALSEFFKKDYTEVLEPIVDYFIDERESREKEQ